MALSKRDYQPLRSTAIRDDSLFASESGENTLDRFPPHHQLIVTTNRSISSWDRSGVSNLFHSGSGGIVASKRLASSGSMLAVADSHVVVLHDIKRARQKSYRLKGSEGQVRLLKYAGNDSQDLYFTTDLLNSVQAFSLKEACMLDSQDVHPSPPAVFALSCDSRLLLSTSADPPLIYLRDIETKTPPILIKPDCSSSAVVAANFHPEDPSIFLLAFADGCVAVYDAAGTFSSAIVSHRTPSQQSSVREIAHIKRVHTSTTRGLQDSDIEDSGHDPATGSTTVTGQVAGVASAALLPKHRAMAVTVGSDGKCCVIDFSQPSRKTAVLLKTWHLRRPATCMSVVYTPQVPHQVDGPDDSRTLSNNDYCIAVGRQDGKVLLFDLAGNQLGERALDPSQSRVIDVEWARREINSAFQKRRKSDMMAARRRSSTRRDERGHVKTSSTAYPKSLISRDAQSILPETNLAQLTPKVATTEPATQAPEPKANRSIFNMELPAFFERGLTRVGARRDRSKKYAVAPITTVKRESISKPYDARRTSGANIRPPPLPSRPVRSPDNQYQARRALTALRAAGVPVSPAEARRISRASARSAAGVSTVSLPRTKVVMGPRAMRRPTTASSRSRTSRSSAPQKLSNVNYPSATTQDAYKTAESRFSTSEGSGSGDTIIDWTAGPPSPEFPKPLNHSATKPEPTKPGIVPARKGHISLSVSSSSVQSSSKVSPSALLDPVPEETPKATRDYSLPAKGHISVPISPDPGSNPSSFTPSELITSSHASSDVVADWGDRRQIPHIFRAPTSSMRKAMDDRTIRARRSSISSQDRRKRSQTTGSAGSQMPAQITLKDNEMEHEGLKRAHTRDENRTITKDIDSNPIRKDPTPPTTEAPPPPTLAPQSTAPSTTHALDNIFPVTAPHHDEEPSHQATAPETRPTVPDMEEPLTLREFQRVLQEEFRALREEIREGFARQSRAGGLWGGGRW